MEKNENTGKIVLYAVLSALMFLEFIFLTSAFQWPMHQVVEIAKVQKIYSIVAPTARYVFLAAIFIELLFSIKDVIKSWRGFVALLFFALIFSFVNIFADPIVLVLYPVCFLAIFFFAVYLKPKKKASIEQEDLNLQDFDLPEKLLEHPDHLHLKIHNHIREGWLDVPNPYRGIIIVGKAGSGKTVSVFNPFIFQMVMKGWVVYNYDYKFPDFTGHLQTCLDLREKAGLPNYPHYVINFDDPFRTHRTNPIHPDSIEDTTELTSIATTFIQNIKPEWVKNKDFWADAAIVYFNAGMLYMYLEHPSMCTLPHVIELCSKPYGEVLPMFLGNPETKKVIVSYVQAQKDKAGQQLAGMSGSLQVFLPNLSKPDIYWPLSGNDCTLEFKNPEKPFHLSVGNTPGLKERFLQPIIGSINKIALTKANRNYVNLQKMRGVKKPLPNIPGGISFDELVTTYVEGLDQVPNVGRSNKICLMIGIQLAPQLIDKYGKEKYQILIGSFGNYFIGLCDADLAELMSKLFGNKKVKQKANSITTSDDGKKSTNANESIKDERAVPVEALTTQPQGHLYGMVTIEHDKGRDMTKEIKKPFFKGYVLFDNKKFEDLSPSKIRKYETPITTMVERDYMIPEFSKFSDAEEFVDRKKDMKEIINENYRKICNDVDHIIKDFERKRDLQEFEEQRKMEEQKEAISTEALVNSLMHADPDEKVVLPDEAYSNDTKENDIPTSYFAG